jgi:redox-sensitive bicupin YhaK (pirin superfamily)
MLLKIPAENIYTADYGWHSGRFHFSFADYVDPSNTHFGVLRALNDFVLQPESGFETHPHSEMEIVSYCVQGELTHSDSMGHHNKLQGGDVQYLCAGSGITHSEMNEMQDRSLRFFQFWIEPQTSSLSPKYNCIQYSRFSKQDKLTHIASGVEREGVIKIAQDANIYTARLSEKETLVYTNWGDRQSYLTCLEGSLTVNETELLQQDALKVWGEEFLNLSTKEEGHFLLIEMAAENLNSG